MKGLVEELRAGAELEEAYDADGIIRTGHQLSLRWRSAAEIERLRDAEVIARTTQANLHSEIDRLRELVRQVVRSSWPPPPSWYAEAQEAAMLESGEFVRSPTAIPRDDDGAA